MSSDFERLNILLTVRDRQLAAALDRNTRKIDRFASNANRGLGSTSRAWDRVGTSARTAAAAQSSAFSMSGAQRFVLQNTTNQVGDMAVQLQMGTSAARVMGQQLPQLFGGFAALGGALGTVAPLLGVVAAVGIPLGAMLLNTGDEAEDAAEDVQTFTDRLAAAEAALARAEAAASMASAGGLVEMQERYGEITEEIRGLTETLADIERRAARVAVDIALDDALGGDFRDQIDRMFGDVGAALINAGDAAALRQVDVMREQIRALEAEIAAMPAGFVPQGMRDDLAAMNEELAVLEGRLADIGGLASEITLDRSILQDLDGLMADLDAARLAGDFAAVADALSAIRGLLAESGAEIDQVIVDGLAQAEDLSRQTALALGQAGDKAVDLGEGLEGLPGSMDPVIAEAARLAAWLGVSLETAQRLQAMGDQGMPGAPNGGRGGDPRENGGSFLDWQTRLAAQFNATDPGTGGTGGTGRGGSGGNRRAEEAREEAEALAELREELTNIGAAASVYSDELARLEAQYAAGEISQDEFQDGLRTIETGFEAAQRRAQALRDQVARTMADIVTGAQSAEDAIASLLSNWASQMAMAGFQGLLGQGGGGFFNLIGGLTGGSFGGKSFDGGGYTGNGPRSGGLDGKGGYLAMVHPRESIIDHTRPASAAGGSGAGPFSINIAVSGARGNSEISDMVRAGVQQGLQEYDRHVLPRSFQAIKSDPRRIG